MKKYKPSITNNNELKNELVKELNMLVYNIEKGKYNSDLDKDLVADIAQQIKNATNSLDNTIGTGDENIAFVAKMVGQQVDLLKKQLNQSLSNRVETSVDELVLSLVLWKDILDGVVTAENEDDIKKVKLSRSRKKLDERLVELDEIKLSFLHNEQRLEKEIVAEEKDVEEYNNLILAEENERKINELFRKVKSAKSKVDMLSVRRSNYSACHSLLDMIYVNSKEILSATDFAAEEIAKAKVLLNISKLKNVLSDPDQAIAILKRMDKELKALASKTASIDEKVFAVDGGNAVINEDALKYKEELMRKKREKEGLNDQLVNATSVDKVDANKIMEEN